MSLVIDVLLWIALIFSAGFTIDYWLYGLHKNRRVEGWHLLTFTGVLALVFAVLLAPDFPGRRVLMVVLVAGVTVALGWRWTILRQVRRETRRARRNKERAR